MEAKFQNVFIHYVLIYCNYSGADPRINYEGQVRGAQEYEYNYEERGGAQAYSTM